MRGSDFVEGTGPDEPDIGWEASVGFFLLNSPILLSIKKTLHNSTNAFDRGHCELLKLQSRINRLAFQGEDSKHTLLDATKRFLVGETLQRFYSEREFAKG